MTKSILISIKSKWQTFNELYFSGQCCYLFPSQALIFLSTVFRFPFVSIRVPFICISFCVADSEESSTMAGHLSSTYTYCDNGVFFAWGAFVFRVLINSIAYKFWHRTFATSICLCTMYLRARSFFYYLSSFRLLRFFSITIAIPSPNQSHSVLSIWEFHVHISFYMGMEYVFMYCVCTWRMNFSCSFRLGLFFCGFPHPLSFRWQQPFNIKLIANVDFQQLLENIFGL